MKIENGKWNGYNVKKWYPDAFASGYCGGEGDGTNLTWTLDKDGVLTISGTGAMYDYSENGTQFNNSDIKSVVIEDGVTSIGNSAFYECTSLSSIILPETLTTLSNEWVFGSCKNLKEVYFYATTLPYIAYGVFRNLNPIIYVPAESLAAYKSALYWQDFDVRPMDVTTSIEDIHTSHSSGTKLLRDGKILIIHEGKTYNIMGSLIK